MPDAQTSASGDTSDRIGYGVSPKRRRRFAWVLAAIGLLLALFRPVWLPPLQRQWRLARIDQVQGRCMAYASLADRAIFAVGDRQSLPRGPGYMTSPATEGVVALYRPPCWEQFKALHPSYVQLSPHALVFLHERRTEDGRPWLLVITLNHSLDVADGDELLAFHWAVYEPGSLRRFPKEVGGGGGGPTLLGPSSKIRSLRVYEGQLDPNDPSAFTIDYEVNGVRRTHHARLQFDRSYGPQSPLVSSLPDLHQ
jgi:hypothetical protein